MKKVFLALVLIGNMWGQPAPKAQLVDEFGFVTCEDLGARASSLLNNLAKAPGSTALIVINPKIDDKSRSEFHRDQILAQMQIAEIEGRLLLVQGEAKQEMAMQFWLIPPGAQRPDVQGTPWTAAPINVKRPFIFGYEDEIGICPTFVPRLYAKLLKQDATSKGHLVVSGPTKHDRKSFADQWLEQFERDFGLPRTRFRVFYVYQEGLAAAEFWFVPKKD